MLVLIATNELQGASPDDYNYTVDGELVTALAAECADGVRCGCNRGFPGLASAKATTTAMVADRPGVTEDDLRDAVFDWLDRTGWVELFETAARERVDDGLGAGLDAGLDAGLVGDVDDLIESVIDEHVEMIAQICAAYPPGTVLTRRGQLVIARIGPVAA